MKQAPKQAPGANLESQAPDYYVCVAPRSFRRLKPFHLPAGDSFQSPDFHFALFCAALGKWTGTTEFHSNSGLLSRSPFSGVFIISKQLSPRPVPRPNYSRPITGQFSVWIWAALLNSAVCQCCFFSSHLFLSHSVFFFLGWGNIFVIYFSCWLIKFSLPVQPVPTVSQNTNLILLPSWACLLYLTFLTRTNKGFLHLTKPILQSYSEM